MMKRLLTLVFAAACIGAVTAPAAAAQPRVFDPAACSEANGEPGQIFTEPVELSEACLAMIEAFPRPLVLPVPQDQYTLSEYSFWKVGPNAIALFDAPGGSVVDEIGQGFNFVRAIDQSVEGWLQIEGGRWIQRDVATYVAPSYFTGVTLMNQLDYPFAWILDLSRIFVSEYPGGPAEQETGRWLRRYELVNIFAVAYDAEGWRWYMIGPNQWVKQTFVSKVQRVEVPETVEGRWVAVDLYEQVLVAYEGSTPVYATLIASGLPNTETNEGLFDVWARLPRDRMAGAAGAPNAYSLQSVPWVMYFDGGISLHGTYWHDLFGYRRSRGCVNLSISDARWLFEWMLNGADYRDENLRNYVYVYSSGEFGVTNSGI
jgi:hypothetical protein